MNGKYDGNYADGLPATRVVGPAGRQIVEGYRKDALDGFPPSQPRSNPMDAGRIQSSPGVDLEDPIQVHLLTETALTDSKEWEILAPEEVDDLKKLIKSLTLRIQQAQANLAIQMKYRDAAISMSKLYTAGNKGARATADPAAQEAAMERQESERRVEELGTELFDLEREILAPQRRLLMHTAAILQLTHMASSQKGQPPVLLHGLPGSPDSLYTYTEGQKSMQFHSDDLDRDLYFPLDDTESFGPSLNTDIPIPPRSPVRERSNQLRDEVEALKKETSVHSDVITATERSLEGLSNRLRDLVVWMSPSKNANYSPAPSGNSEPGELVRSRLQYLDEGLSTIRQDYEAQSRLLADSSKTIDQSAAEMLQVEQKLDNLIRQAFEAAQSVGGGEPAPPADQNAGMLQRLDWLESTLSFLQTSLSNATSDLNGAKEADRMEAVLASLWDTIQAGYADISRQREARKRDRPGGGMSDDEDDVSADEPFDYKEPYSLDAFSARVQWLFGQATGLKEQKSVLKRQIRQQRDLNSKSNTEREVELRSKVEELNMTKTLLTAREEDAQRSKTEAVEAQKKLSQALADLDSLQAAKAANEPVANSGAKDQQLRERNAKIATLEEDRRAMQDKMEIIEAQLGAVIEQLKEADDTKQAAEDKKRELEEQIKAKDEDIERLNVSMIEIKTELTIAKAELEGAYGSRSERAAEAAALGKPSKTQKETEESQTLKAELAATLKELEELTKEVLAAEKDKVDLESRLDEAVSTRSTLEADLAALKARHDSEVTKLKEQLDAEKFKAGPNASGTGPRAGASMLSEQFRTTMKAERKKFQEDLKEEQARRRKLEDEMRALKKSSALGRVSLNPP